MQNLFVCILFSFLTILSAEVFAAEKPIIISGFDDVLRQAENTSLLKAAIKIFEEDKTFTGMPELYQTVSKDRPQPRFFLVSAISHWLDGRIENFLIESKYPSNQRYLRHWLTEWSIEDFKLESIRQILRDQPDKKFIVIFDNSDPSLKLAQQIRLQFSNQVLAIYLRQVVDKPLPAGATEFYTAFDIARAEYLAERLSKEELFAIGESILKESQASRLIPAYAQCPKETDAFASNPKQIEPLCQQVAHHVWDLCNRPRN